MTWERWLLGVLVIAAVVIPAFATAPGLRRRLVPSWPRAPALLADAVVAITGIVLMAELLGAVGLFRPLPLAAGGLLVGLAFRALGRPPAGTRKRGDLRLGGRWEVGCAAAAVGGLFAQAVNSAAHRAGGGILDPDSLHYHLPFAARFARSGWTTDIAYVSAGDAAPYHPATAELLHGLGLVAWRVEVLTLVLNFGALALALLAAAALGAVRGRGAASVAATAAILALPMLGRDQAGSPYNDVLAIAFLLAGVAFAAWALDDRRVPLTGGLALGGVALGLAVGTKTTTLIPAALVVIAVAALAGSPRAAGSRLAWLLPTAVLTAGYWPLRNLAQVGNPLPAALPVFPRPPMPALVGIEESVAHYLTDPDVVRQYYLPGLEYAIGPAILLVAALVLVAAAAAVLPPRDGLRQLFGAAMLLALLAYLVTPTTAGGPDGDPVLFRFNVRYAGPALCVLVAVAPLWSRWAPRAIWWCAAWLAALALTLLDGASWADASGRPAAVGVVLGLAVGCALAIALRGRPRALRAGIAAVAVIATAGGGALARHYVDDLRYADPRTDRDRLVALGRNVEGGRTGVTGLPLQFSFFGPDLDGAAVYVAEVLPTHEARDPPTCAAWREALRHGRYDRIVVLRRGAGAPLPAAAAWTASLPGAVTVMANGAGRAYTLPPRIGDAGCPPG